VTDGGGGVDGGGDGGGDCGGELPPVLEVGVASSASEKVRDSDVIWFSRDGLILNPNAAMVTPSLNVNFKYVFFLMSLLCFLQHSPLV